MGNHKTSPPAMKIASVCVLLLSILPPLAAIAEDAETRAPAQWKAAELKKGYVVFEHSTIQNLPASHVPAPNDVVKSISCTLARDEYESVQIGVHALVEGIKDIQVSVESDLKVTVYHRINPAVKEELAALYEAGNGIARWMPSEVHLERGNRFEELPKAQSLNFWLTFRADTETREGLHPGKIRITREGRWPTVLDLEVHVRPFQLQRPRAAFGIWLREDMLPKRFGGLATPKETVLAIYRDMVDHGHNSNWFYPAGSFDQLPPRNSQAFDKLMPLSQQAGLLDPDIPWLICGGTPAGLDDAAKRKAAVAWIEAECRKHGWPEIIAFGPDEPSYPEDAEEVRKLTRMRGLTMRVNLDQSSAAAAYEFAGDICDVQNVMDGLISPEMLAEMRRVGTEVWTYTYRIWRERFDPLPQRYFAGLYTWTHKLGGNWVWAYHHGHHRYAWFAPESHEPMPVTGWEARREGIDDYRYLQMVEDCVAANPDNPSAIEAAKWLETLRTRLAPTVPNKVEVGKPLALREYDEIRATAAAYIRKLGPVPNEAVTRPPITHSKDEAARCRGKSVEECIAALAASEVSERRAAAWALSELGPKAAPAVESLTRVLADPEVRIPALHVLEAVGPEAHRAVPEIAKLLEHPDPYVRLGATLTLGNIGCPLDTSQPAGSRSPSPHASIVVEPLLVAFRDDTPKIASLAEQILVAMGPLAKPALTDAIRQLLKSAEFADRHDALQSLLDKLQKEDTPEE